jgi:hypothetical protein
VSGERFRNLRIFVEKNAVDRAFISEYGEFDWTPRGAKELLSPARGGRK